MKARELRDLLETNEKVVVVDVREPEEIEEGGTIEGAVNVPMHIVLAKEADQYLPQDAKIIAICTAGKRCAVAAEELIAEGFDADYLEGGLTAWNAEA